MSEVFCAIACKAASCSPAEARVGRLLAGLLDSALGTSPWSCIKSASRWSSGSVDTYMDHRSSFPRKGPAR